MNRDFNSGTKDLMKLIDSGSDSDTVELLTLPPLKKTSSKPSKRRRSHSNGQNMCSIWVLLKTILALILIGSMSFFGVTTFQLTKRVANLQSQIKNIQAENSNQGIPAELESIKSQLQDWNKTLLGYRSGKQGLDEVIKNLTTVSQQVKLLQTLLKEIKKKMGQYNDESSMDGHNLAKNMADIGSDVETVKKQHAELEDKTNKNIQKLEDRLTQLENQLKMVVMPSMPPSSDSTNIEQTTEMTAQLGQLQQALQITNTSLVGQINVIRQELSNHEDRFEALESQASKEPVTINTTAILVTLRSQLTNYIQSVVSNSTKSTSPVVLDSVMDTIKEEVKNISQSVDSLEQQIKTDGSSADSVKLVKALEVLHGHLNSTDTSVQNMNNSLGKLETTVDKLMHLYVEEKNVIVNLTHHVHGILRYLDQLPGPHGTLHSDTTQANTTPVPHLETQTTETTKTENRRDTSNLKEEIHEIFE